MGDPDQCLVAGTLITMADGSTRPIEDVGAGDEVLLVLRERRLRARARHARPPCEPRQTGIAITTASGRRIVSTPEHVHFAGFKTGRTPHCS